MSLDKRQRDNDQSALGEPQQIQRDMRKTAEEKVELAVDPPPCGELV